MIQNFPKKYQKKVKELSEYLKDVRSENGRVVYEDGDVGSYLTDLIKYFVYPTMLKMKRPSDATKFGILLKKLGVPDTLLSRPLVKQEAVNWKTF